MEIPPQAHHRVAHDHVAWLTTVTDSGAPAPNPVWFVQDGDDLVVFSDPTARKVHNIAKRPAVTIHFNSNAEGGDVVIISGQAALTHGKPPSALNGYLEKYESTITGPLGMTVEDIDQTYNTEVRIRPTRIRLTST
jgi:PPOX class probable F420-dependent enzyme